MPTLLLPACSHWRRCCCRCWCTWHAGRRCCQRRSPRCAGCARRRVRGGRCGWTNGRCCCCACCCWCCSRSGSPIRQYPMHRRCSAGACWCPASIPPRCRRPRPGRNVAGWRRGGRWSRVGMIARLRLRLRLRLRRPAACCASSTWSCRRTWRSRSMCPTRWMVPMRNAHSCRARSNGVRCRRPRRHTGCHRTATAGDPP